MNAEKVKAAFEELLKRQTGAFLCNNESHRTHDTTLYEDESGNAVIICAACLAELLTPDDGMVTVRLTPADVFEVSELSKQHKEQTLAMGLAIGEEVACIARFDAALKEVDNDHS